MKWAEVSVISNHEATEAVANILHEAGAGGVIIEDSELFPEEEASVKAYFPVNSYLMETIEQIKLQIVNLKLYGINIGNERIHISEVDDEDWSSNWKKYYKPVQITDNIVISPVWEEIDKKANQIVIELDPGMAFGTGTHPTTVMCIKALEKYIKGNEDVIDVGCGTGVLSIAAAKLGVKHVESLDLDDVAVESAKRNVKLNNVDSIVTVKQNNLLDRVDQQVDIVIANILAEVILNFTNDVARILKPNGLYITSGIIQTKENMVKEALEKAGFIIEDTFYTDDWLAIISRKV